MYSEEEVEAVVEGYDELTGLRHKSFIQVRLLDVELAMRKLSMPHRQAVMLCGLMGFTTRAAGGIMGVSSTTMHKRYRRGLRELVQILNGGKR